jgi:hypothetical protein
MFTPMNMRRWRFSREIWVGPSTTRMSAMLRSGTVAPFRVGTRMLPMASSDSRKSAGKRTTAAKRRCPSNTKVATLPVSAVSMMVFTSETLMPCRAMAWRSMVMV